MFGTVSPRRRRWSMQNERLPQATACECNRAQGFAASRSNGSVGRVDHAMTANEVLSKLRPVSKQKLMTGATIDQFERSAVIYHEDTPAARFSLVLRGEVKLVTYSSKGTGLLIDIVLPNQLFGVVFHPHSPVHPCTAVALKPTELLSLRRKEFMDELETNLPLQRCCWPTPVSNFAGPFRCADFGWRRPASELPRRCFTSSKSSDASYRRPAPQWLN